jgi:2-keto-4-pentenoate hydratase/2-oxohepta-3-ene-1,7-dioic acid hydratase in catechol pathway
MLYVQYEKNGEPRYGWVDGRRVGAVTGDIFGSHKRETLTMDVADLKILPPTRPTKIIAIAQNYPSRAAEENQAQPEIPTVYLKPPSAVIGYGDEIVLPPQSSQVEHEAELAVVLGRRARWVSVEDALKFVWGYTCVNDITARDLERRDAYLTRSKGFDTFCPLGPYVSTDVDPADVVITCSVNGQLRQMISTREMIFSVPQLIAFVSSIMTLEPGDVILTGTPGGVGPLVSGDQVEVEIEGVGKLINKVK